MHSGTCMNTLSLTYARGMKKIQKVCVESDVMERKLQEKWTDSDNIDGPCQAT